MLMNEEGEITSHLQGFLSRTTMLLENNIKPIFVFDGKPPTMKSGELARRREAKQKAEADLESAEKRMGEAEQGTEEHQAAVDEINKAQKRSVKVTTEHNQEVKKLLSLMGLPIVEAPCEAEAQCAELCKGGKVWGSGTEDMDALALATPILLRKLTAAQAKKEPVIEIHLEKVLGPDGLDMTMDQFIDMCILCGCDYCEPIPRIGPKSALKLIKEHGTIEKVIESLDREKYPIPAPMENQLDEIRKLFKQPDVTPCSETPDFAFSSPDEEGLLQFLVQEKGFAEDRVKKMIDRLKKARQGSQTRLDAFFGSSSTGNAAFKVKQSVKQNKKGTKTGPKNDRAASAKKMKSS